MAEKSFSKAFVFLNTETDRDVEVLEKVKLISSVQEAYRVYGTYDIIFKIEEENIADLKNTITKKIRIIDGVQSSLTLMIM